MARETRDMRERRDVKFEFWVRRSENLDFGPRTSVRLARPARPARPAQLSCRSSLVVPHVRTIEVLACYNSFSAAC